MTFYEKKDYFGGQTHTVMIPDGPDRGTPVDTGVIVLNPRTYPNFIRFMDLLGVAISPTAMSFGSYCKSTGLYYAPHGDQAPELLKDPDGYEKRLLGAWTYSRNETWLHTDRSVMPPGKRAWACLQR